MAERLGFEPRKELPLCRFSRPVLSTAQPSLREQGFISINLKFNKKNLCLFELIYPLFNLFPNLSIAWQEQLFFLYKPMSCNKTKKVSNSKSLKKSNQFQK